MTLTPYKPNQGLYARGAAAAALLLLDLLVCVRLHEMLGEGGSFMLLGMSVPKTALWVAAVFVVAGAFIAVLTFALETGLKSVDAKTQSLVDLLVDTQGELQKVSWPSRDELRRLTTVVLIFIVILGCFLFVADMIVNFVMTNLGVLPTPGK